MTSSSKKTSNGSGDVKPTPASQSATASSQSTPSVDEQATAIRVDSTESASAPSAATSIRSTRASQNAPAAQVASAVPPRFQQSYSAVDPDLVSETKNQIRALVQEITDLANSNCELEAFYEGFLTRTVGALGGVGGAVWQKSGSGTLELKYQINLAQTNLSGDQAAQVRHSRMLQQLILAGQPTLVPPNSGESSDEAGNPTEHLLVVGVVTLDQDAVGLIEVFQRSGAGPTTQRGYLRFVAQMSEIAGGYLKNRRLRQFSEQQEMWSRLEEFIRSIHRSLDLQETMYAIANEGRRVVECDRVSVALRQGGRFRIEVVSGLDSIERRADQVKLLSQLVTTAMRGRQPLWYTPDSTDLPPQIERTLNPYLDRSHVKSLVIVPVARQPAHREKQPSTSLAAPNTTPLAALVFEHLTASQITPSTRTRIETVTNHGRDALTASLDHSRIFLLPVWRALGQGTSLLRGRRLMKLAIISAVVLSCLAALWVVPYPFTLGAKGQLMPQSRHEIFAPIDGTLDQILVDDGSNQWVESGQVLARLSNNDLLVAIEDLEGQLNQWSARRESLFHSWNEQKNSIDKLQVERDLSEADSKLSSLSKQLQLKRQQLALLEIRAPVRGQVVNWRLRQSLLQRPVQTGQSLMTIVDPDSEWELELELPERRVGHLLDAAKQANQPLSIHFTLASLPNRQLTGHIVEIDRRMEVRSDQGNCVRVRVAFDKHDMSADLLKAGTRATAEIECGQRSIGYVWFRELIETVYGTWLMWF